MLEYESEILIVGGGLGGQLLATVIGGGAAPSTLGNVAGSGIGGIVVMAIVGFIKQQMAKNTTT